MLAKKNKYFSFTHQLSKIVVTTLSFLTLHANANTTPTPVENLPQAQPQLLCDGLGDVIRTHKPVSQEELLGHYDQRADVKAYAQKVSECYHLDPNWVLQTLEGMKYQASSAKFIIPKPAGQRHWQKFITQFVLPTRVQAGVKFWNQNTKWLELAQTTYGVPPEVILGILGVETIFGQFTGNFRIVDALGTLSFDFPQGRSDRTDFFADELAKYLVFTSTQNIDPFSIRGSYAGAMGMPQFMPSSLLSYGVDFDKDGHIDLHGNVADIIGSVANYLAQHGWQEGIPASFPVTLQTANEQNIAILAQPDITPTFTREQIAQHGVLVHMRSNSKKLADDVKLSFIVLPNGTELAPDYVAGTHNFFVITRYNRSSFYAMSVIELGNAIVKAQKEASK